MILPPRDLYVVPRAMVRWQFRDLRSLLEPTRGGHFFALEQPAVLAEHLLAFVHQVEANS